MARTTEQTEYAVDRDVDATSLYEHTAAQLDKAIGLLDEAVDQLRLRLQPVTDPNAIPADTPAHVEAQLARPSSAPVIERMTHHLDRVRRIADTVGSTRDQLVI